MFARYSELPREEKKWLRDTLRDLHRIRREAAEQEFVSLRREFGDHATYLDLSILVPVCCDCWLYELRRDGIPQVSADNWQLDLVLLGFDLSVIQKLEEDIAEGIEAERGPSCHYCSRWLPYWEDEDGCYTMKVRFSEYFSFPSNEGPSVSKAVRREVKKMYGGKCFACGLALTDSDLSIDHIVASSKGGNADLINLQLMCARCNNAKADSGIETQEVCLHFPMRPVPSDSYEDVTW